ncbi:MAG TPA: ANTAR domain-containing protein [Microlunatus sp.]|nr:ANTAR domain-containing protein [Microlunatus sp.]
MSWPVAASAPSLASQPTNGGRRTDPVLGQEVATWIALAVGNADAAAKTSDELRNMHIAMKSRAMIDQAKGILMERYKLNEDRAFAVLARASQTSNIKLRDVAQELIDTGTLRGVAPQG